MLSSQRFLEEGLARGREDVKALLEAHRQICASQRRRPTALPALLTLGHLACRTKVPLETLRYYVTRSAENPYRRFYVRKRSGGRRWISVPSEALHTVQRWLSAHVLRHVPVHPASKAFRPGDSIRACAEEHAGARWLVKLDIADFFGSITEIQVFRAFTRMGYNRLVSMQLARLCTDTPRVSAKYRFQAWRAKHKWPRIPGYQQRFLGRLPQGAPSSPMLANLAVADIDAAVAEIAGSYGLTYTRYSDDITLSTRGTFSRRLATHVIEEVAQVLKVRGLYLNRKKTSVSHPGARRVVLGLLVDGLEPRLTKTFRDRLRQHLYYLETRGIAAHVAARSFDSAGGLYRHLRGLIDYANSVDPAYASALRSRLDALPWLGVDRGAQRAGDPPR